MVKGRKAWNEYGDRMLDTRLAQIARNRKPIGKKVERQLAANFSSNGQNALLKQMKKSEKCSYKFECRTQVIFITFATDK